jgi:hypothetical protein
MEGLIAELICFEHWGTWHQTCCSLTGQAIRRMAGTWRDAKTASITLGNSSCQIAFEWNVKNFRPTFVDLQGWFVWHHGSANVLHWARGGQLFKGIVCLMSLVRV